MSSAALGRGIAFGHHRANVGAGRAGRAGGPKTDVEARFRDLVAKSVSVALESQRGGELVARVSAVFRSPDRSMVDPTRKEPSLRRIGFYPDFNPQFGKIPRSRTLQRRGAPASLSP